LYPPPLIPLSLRPVRGPAVFALAALAFNALVRAVATWSDLRVADFIERALTDPAAISQAEADSIDQVANAISRVSVASMGLGMVAFLVWLFRVRSNAEVLAPTGHRFSRTWVFWAWVVPFISWLFPKRIVSDIADASFGSPRSARKLITFWWLTWLAGNWVLNAVNKAVFRSGDPGELLNSAQLDAFANVVMMFAAGLAAAVVTTISKAQERRLESPILVTPLAAEQAS
jgi:hypothetical protein